MGIINWIKNLFGKAQTAADKGQQLITDGKEVIKQATDVVDTLKNMDNLTLDNVGAKAKEVIAESKEVLDAAKTAAASAKEVVQLAHAEATQAVENKVEAVQEAAAQIKEDVQAVAQATVDTAKEVAHDAATKVEEATA